MSPESRQQYLQAMGIQLWQSRFPIVTEQVPVAEVVIEQSAVDNTVVEQIQNETIVSDIQSPSVDSDLSTAVNNCVACELHQTRTQAVISEGSETARLMMITTAPAMNAESPTSLLTAESSQLFTKMLQAIQFSRSDIYFTSLVKCQLPQDRELRTTEVLCCEQYLNQQIELVKPDLIVALGEVSAQQLVVSKKTLTELRGKAYQYQSVPLMVMSHPDDLLNTPEDKRNAWHDLLQIQQKLNG